MATIKGEIKAISISEKKGTKKTNVPEAEVRIDFGLVGDAHGGNWHRQISLLAIESINKMIEMGADVLPGSFAENITTQGIELPGLTIGSRLRIGKEIELEVTQIGKECHSRCEIFKQVGDCIMPREGVFAEVMKAGRIKVGDMIEVFND
ncbi:MAG: MOSC domain-containing protein [Planctomycetota bacterium]|jgi:MOSC domain-containing protein YiiM